MAENRQFTGGVTGGGSRSTGGEASIFCLWPVKEYADRIADELHDHRERKRPDKIQILAVADCARVDTSEHEHQQPMLPMKLPAPPPDEEADRGIDQTHRSPPYLPGPDLKPEAIQ